MASNLRTESDTLLGNVNTIDHVVVEDTEITRTGHYGLWIKALGLAGNNDIKNTNIRQRMHLHKHGRIGFVPNRCRDVVVEHCVYNHTGSSVDERMWKRGSGTWTFKCERVLIQNNRLMNAHGPQDSYSAHIDYGNKDVVIQYNLSFNNEGGFAEVLGDNINCGYRYNISINDGYREDPDGLPWNKKGKIFWVSTFVAALFDAQVWVLFFTTTPFMLIPRSTPKSMFGLNRETFTLNNIICMASDGETLQSFLEDQDNQYSVGTNLFYPLSRIALDEDLFEGALMVDPVFNVPNSAMIPLQSALNFQLQPNSPATDAPKWRNRQIDFGRVLWNPSIFSMKLGGRDFFGQTVYSTLVLPSIGALRPIFPAGPTAISYSSEAMCLPINPEENWIFTERW